ncbi:MAG: hypothetical protein ACK5NF_03255 [Bacilli bacterium]
MNNRRTLLKNFGLGDVAEFRTADEAFDHLESTDSYYMIEHVNGMRFRGATPRYVGTVEELAEILNNTKSFYEMTLQDGRLELNTGIDLY